MGHKLSIVLCYCKLLCFLVWIQVEWAKLIVPFFTPIHLRIMSKGIFDGWLPMCKVIRGVLRKVCSVGKADHRTQSANTQCNIF